MLTAALKDGRRVHAFETAKTDGPFTCPACLCQTILKRGRVKIPHFAHEPGVNCPESQGETPLHLQTKMAIFKALCASPACGPGKCGPEIRLTLGNRFQVADILARIGSELVAIEIQRSVITPDAIIKRTLFYTERDIATLWVVPRNFNVPARWDDEIGAWHPGRLRINQTERFLWRLYYGHLYSFDGSGIVPVSLAPATTFVDYTDYGGGYHKTLKSYKCPNTWGLVDPCEFTTVRRAERQELPRALLWLHKPTLDKLQDIRKASKK